MIQEKIREILVERVRNKRDTTYLVISKVVHSALRWELLEMKGVVNNIQLDKYIDMKIIILDRDDEFIEIG